MRSPPPDWQTDVAGDHPRRRRTNLSPANPPTTSKARPLNSGTAVIVRDVGLMKAELDKKKSVLAAVRSVVIEVLPPESPLEPMRW